MAALAAAILEAHSRNGPAQSRCDLRIGEAHTPPEVDRRVSGGRRRQRAEISCDLSRLRRSSCSVIRLLPAAGKGWTCPLVTAPNHAVVLVLCTLRTASESTLRRDSLAKRRRGVRGCVPTTQAGAEGPRLINERRRLSVVQPGCYAHFMDDLKMYARMGLQVELDRLDARRAELVALLQQLEDRAPQDRPRKRRMSAEGRERIREAVQRRWAKVRAEQATIDEPPPAAQGQAARAGRKPAVGRRAAGMKK